VLILGLRSLQFEGVGSESLLRLLSGGESSGNRSGCGQCRQDKMGPGPGRKRKKRLKSFRKAVKKLRSARRKHKFDDGGGRSTTSKVRHTSSGHDAGDTEALIRRGSPLKARSLLQTKSGTQRAGKIDDCEAKKTKVVVGGARGGACSLYPKNRPKETIVFKLSWGPNKLSINIYSFSKGLPLAIIQMS